MPEAVSDHQFLNNIRPEQAREFLLNHINRKLEVSSANLNKGISDYISNVSSADDTSNQIVSNIHRALTAHNINPNNQSEKLATITREVNSGFTEARQIFKNLNILRNDFLTDLDNIEQNVNAALNKISSTAALTNEKQFEIS